MLLLECCVLERKRERCVFRILRSETEMLGHLCGNPRNVGDCPAWLFQISLFGLCKRNRSFALLRLRSFTCFCVRSHLEQLGFGNFRTCSKLHSGRRLLTCEIRIIKQPPDKPNPSFSFGPSKSSSILTCHSTWPILFYSFKNIFVNIGLDIFKTPVTVTPPARNFKNFKLFKNSLKILNVYF